MKVKLKIHELYEDDIYWMKVSAILSKSQRESVRRIRTEGIIPKTQKQRDLVVYCHKLINKDERTYEEIILDLLSETQDFTP